MHIGIVGPIASADIVHLLDDDSLRLPKGYAGAPLLVCLIEGLLQRGHRVSAFSVSADMPLNRKASVTAGGKKFSISFCPMRPRAWQPNGWLPGRIVDFFGFERNALQHAIKREAPDVIHAHWAYEFALAALATKIPHVVTCHDSPYKVARLASCSRLTVSAYRWLRILMARKVMRNSKCMTAVSPYMRDEIQALTTARIAVVPNPVDNLALALARHREVPVVPRLAMVCNGWSDLKNPQPALLAFAELRISSPDAELHLFGHDFGPGETAESWCTQRRIENGMVFHGSLPHQRLLQSLAELDLLLHPSLEESFGVVIAEALTMGLPVVAGKSSGAVPWVVGGGGHLCDVRSPEDIKKTLLSVLDSKRYGRLSSEGMASARDRFSADQVIDQYLNLYKQVVGQQVEYIKQTVTSGEVA